MHEADGARGGAGTLKGVFSTVKAGYIGEGATKRKVMSEAYFYVDELPDGTVAVQALNENYVPSGPVNILERGEVEARFVPEPGVYSQKMIPAVRELSKTIAKAERLRKQGNPYTAEFEFANALKIDETNIRATFGLGLSLLDRGENAKADGVFKQLIVLEETFQTENTHLFNEFGISLRKNKMYDQALAYYEQAYKVSPHDEHLLFNMARTCLEMGALDKASAFAAKALELRPDFPEAKELRAVIEKKQAKAGKA